MGHSLGLQRGFYSTHWDCRGAFYSRENWHVPYIYGRRPGGHIWELQCWLWKARGHLFLMQAKESRMPCALGAGGDVKMCLLNSFLNLPHTLTTDIQGKKEKRSPIKSRFSFHIDGEPPVARHEKVIIVNHHYSHKMPLWPLDWHQITHKWRSELMWRWVKEVFQAQHLLSVSAMCNVEMRGNRLGR